MNNKDGSRILLKQRNSYRSLPTESLATLRKLDWLLNRRCLKNNGKQH